jgi:hypothetical protein
MRAIRGLLFLPIILFVSPALLLLALVILIMDTKEGPLRLLLLDEIRAFGWSRGFERFMSKVFIPTYVHNVQAFVLGAAGFLVITVGLRGLGFLPIWVVFISLGLEFTLLVFWAITVFYTPEEEITETENVLAHETAPEPEPPVIDVDKIANAMRELSAHLALLENRLRVTETRFEQLGKLDSSLQGLSSKLNAIVSDQFNLRVRREFETLVSEISQRTITNDKTEGR